jgi:hypothetical protein
MGVSCMAVFTEPSANSVSPLPACGGGRERNERVRGTISVQSLCDNFQNAVDIAHHIVVPKAQHTIAMLGEPAIALDVVGIGSMLAAVDLNDEPPFAATKSTTNRPIGS